MTLGLAFVGALLGGVLGAGLLAVLGLIVDGRGGFPYVWDAFVVAGVLGAFLGGVLAPLAGWLFLRHVPFGRVFGGMTAGTALGACLGLLATGLNPVMAVGGAVAGFATAVVALRVSTERSTVEPDAPAG